MSTCDARPSSGASWLGGMSVETVDLSASISSGMRGMRACGFGLLAQRQQDPLLAGAAVEVARRRGASGRSWSASRAVHVLDAARDVDPAEAALRPTGSGRPTTGPGR